MNIYLLEIFSKWISIAFISLTTMFNIEVETYENQANNANLIKNNKVESIINEYNTIYQYSNSLPSNVKKTIVEGMDEIVYKINNEEVVIQEKVDEIIEIGVGGPEEYVGTLTGYGPDCEGCSKYGNVSCLTHEKVKHSLVNDGIYYMDSEYGLIRIIAADHRVFPCGSIIEIENNKMEKTLAIVLDTGGAMRQAYNKDKIHIDLAFESESVTAGVTNYRTNFTVKRYGW